MYSYSEAVDFKGHLVDSNIIGCLMFSVLLNVINIKLQLELKHKSAVAFFISLMTTMVYYGLLFSHDNVVKYSTYELAGAVPEQMTTLRGVLV
jgi:hypothetical protein